MTKFALRIASNGKYRTLKVRFLAREYAEAYRAKFYPTRAYEIVELAFA